MVTENQIKHAPVLAQDGELVLVEGLQGISRIYKCDIIIQHA